MVVPTPIPEHHERYQLDPYYIAGGWPAPMPLVAAFGVSALSVGVPDLSDPRAERLSVDIGATSRWISDPAKLVDHGDGFYRWTPSQGDDLDAYWEFPAANVPTVDATYSWTLSDGTEMVMPAFIFPGSVWARLRGFVDDTPGYTVIVVARMRGSNGGVHANIIASVVAGNDPDTATDCALQMEGDYIRTMVIGHQTRDLLTDTGRPHIIGSSQGNVNSSQVLLDNNVSWKAFLHPPVTAYDLSWFLARASGSYVDALTLQMDCLEINVWRAALSHAHIRDAVTKLNSFYGVTG